MKNIYDILKRYWSYDQFRPLQEEAIQAAMSQKDSLVLFPTGGGKSACFQVAAMAMDGLCIVISPLIALMQDQVNQLRAKDILADYVHSGLNYFEIDRILDNAIFGKTKFLYMSPERLRHPLTIERIKQMNVNLLAIDEAHCISQWGHDFRPAYRLVHEIKAFMPKTPVMALTATATIEVQKDIIEQLELKTPVILSRSFKRDNLAIIVEQKEQKLPRLIHMLQRMKASSIVYVRSRSKTKEIADFLIKNSIPAAAYHAGLNRDTRDQVMDNWINNKLQVVVSTNAFGMGVDKSDVRLVVHMDIPPSLEEYYQEAGRAGRDGKKAFGVILFSKSDWLHTKSQLLAQFPPRDFIQRVYKCLGHYYDLATGSGEGESYDFDLKLFVEKYNLRLAETASALQILEHSGWIVMNEAFFQPSRIMMVADKESLYGYQIRDKTADVLIKLMLRTYEGMFSNFTRISEAYLSNKLRTSERIVCQILEQLAADEIIDYLPKSDQAKITFLLARSTAINFTIDKKMLAFRKERAIKHIASIEEFLFTEACRLTVLLKYFGEQNPQACGKCDRCIYIKEPPDQTTYNKYKAFILKNINEQILLPKLIALFPSNRVHQVEYTLKKMEEEQWIVRRDDLLFLHPSKKN